VLRLLFFLDLFFLRLPPPTTEELISFIKDFKKSIVRSCSILCCILATLLFENDLGLEEDCGCVLEEVILDDVSVSGTTCVSELLLEDLINLDEPGTTALAVEVALEVDVAVALEVAVELVVVLVGIVGGKLRGVKTKFLAICFT
tara:strand:+ start:254 stop:688 length:435 start_codon:yes stop_codon:yes gene_type:complete